MGLSLLSDSSTTRILARYGQRSGSIINATGTGTQVILSVNPKSANSDIKDVFTGTDGKLYITAFSSSGSPIRPHTLDFAETRRSLTGRLVSYRKYPTVDIDLTVIGNSLDYYKLSILASYYLKQWVKSQRDPIGYNDTVTTYQESASSLPKGIIETNNTQMPLLDMQIYSNSAPGAKVDLMGGTITGGDTIMGLDGNSKISDRTFSFSFAAVSQVSWSTQKYEPGTRPNVLEQVTGVEFA